MKVLVVIAACNDAASLDRFLPKLSQVVKKRLSKRSRILVIDDGSSDQTYRVAKKHGCLALRNSENLGIGMSLRRGYQKAVDGGYDVVATMDADGQHDQNFLLRMIEQVENGADIAIASRYHPDSERIEVPLDRDLLNIAVTAQMRVATGWNVTDPLCGFWVMRRHCFEFALKHGRQERYGVHLEHLVKFWYLATPRPKLVEIPHPAIYGNHGTRELLTREYSPANKETRVDRFGTHALHIIEALDDVKRVLHGTVDREMSERRKHTK
ncbi:glycosyltransferase family 2 protein [Candidatus Nomurabacteria bacterium]|nr:glycosyltransferase family 2 protein [Candidatus Nomurabacteria bacterium]